MRAVPMKAEQENIRCHGIQLHMVVIQIRVLEIDLVSSGRAVRSLTNEPSQELSVFCAL